MDYMCNTIVGKHYCTYLYESFCVHSFIPYFSSVMCAMDYMYNYTGGEYHCTFCSNCTLFVTSFMWAMDYIYKLQKVSIILVYYVWAIYLYVWSLIYIFPCIMCAMDYMYIYNITVGRQCCSILYCYVYCYIWWHCFFSTNLYLNSLLYCHVCYGLRVQCHSS